MRKNYFFKFDCNEKKDQQIYMKTHEKLSIVYLENEVKILCEPKIIYKY